MLIIAHYRSLSLIIAHYRSLVLIITLFTYHYLIFLTFIQSHIHILAQGLVSAAWGGLLHACIAGSSFNIVGPTGALSGILSAYSVHYGHEILPFLSILTGI